jgi:toxin-antitoxin system PIN domain toxin
MKPALLDVNVLIALLDSRHEFHDTAHAWFQRNQGQSWATCPITENGCLRIMSRPGYPTVGLSVERLRAILAEMVSAQGHLFWPDSISLLDPGRFGLAGVGPKHLTDLYLLGLAVKFSGRLVTFDRAIRWQLVTGCGPENLEVL